jgi:DNA-directed RNA polymerase subunit N
MLSPIRCFSCGALLGDKYEKFNALVAKGMEPSKALDKLGIKRYCCRRMILSNFEAINKMLPYAEAAAFLNDKGDEI